MAQQNDTVEGEGGREGGREGRRDGRRKGGKEGWKEGGREEVQYLRNIQHVLSSPFCE